MKTSSQRCRVCVAAQSCKSCGSVLSHRVLPMFCNKDLFRYKDRRQSIHWSARRSRDFGRLTKAYGKNQRQVRWTIIWRLIERMQLQHNPLKSIPSLSRLLKLKELWVSVMCCGVSLCKCWPFLFATIIFQAFDVPLSSAPAGLSLLTNLHTLVVSVVS